jgi:hypothetical protein
MYRLNSLVNHHSFNAGVYSSYTVTRGRLCRNDLTVLEGLPFKQDLSSLDRLFNHHLHALGSIKPAGLYYIFFPTALSHGL